MIIQKAGRPTILCSEHAVSSGHYLATAAAFRILENGGNAIDAGVAAGIALNVVLPGSTSFGGVAPILIYSAKEKEVSSISGLGYWPKSASIQHFKEKRKGVIPEGVERMVVPAAPDAWMTALAKHGTMTFEQIVTPAMEYANEGIAIGESLSATLETFHGQMGLWPTRDEIFAPGRKKLGVGDVLKQPALANTFKRLIEMERASECKGRVDAIKAARNIFYKGEIAQEIANFVQENGGFLSFEDLNSFKVGRELPVSVNYDRYKIFTNGPWCQGPVFAETLKILSSDDLRSLGHNSVDYIHLVAEALKLSFADRDAFYGDPNFVDVPIEGLLSKDYCNSRRNEIDASKAFPAMPPYGDPWMFEGRAQPSSFSYVQPDPVYGNSEPDTSYVCVIDRWGNMFSATPSDGQTAIVPELGFTPSTRGSQTWLDPNHPSALVPGKRPRLTPNALLAFKDGQAWMPFGTPGGDAQVQATIQFFLNQVVFDMSPQEAVEAPRFLVWSFPDSFWPHVYTPGRMELESRFDKSIGFELQKKGHLIEWLPPVSGRANNVCGITRGETGTLMAAADHRSEAYAMGR